MYDFTWELTKCGVSSVCCYGVCDTFLTLSWLAHSSRLETGSVSLLGGPCSGIVGCVSLVHTCQYYTICVGGGRGRDGGCFQSRSLGIKCRSNRASLHKWDCSELADNIHVYLGGL